jgi:hypothetical protein
MSALLRPVGYLLLERDRNRPYALRIRPSQRQKQA